MTRTLPLIAMAAAALALAPAAQAAEHQIRMLNSGGQGMMVFEPAAVKAKPGDTIRFVPTDKGHGVDTIAGMLPAGATPIHGAMGQDFVVKLTKPGLYGVKCVPHLGFGMVALIEVGSAPANLAQAQAAANTLPPMARKRMTADFAQLH